MEPVATLRPLLVCVLALALASFAAACGGDEGTLGDRAGTVETAVQEQLEEATADDEVVQQEAARLQSVLDQELDELSRATTLDDVEASVDDALAELETSRERLEDTDVSDEAREQRDDLVDAIERVERELDELEQAVEEGDLAAALDRVTSLSLDELRREVDEAATSP